MERTTNHEIGNLQYQTATNQASLNLLCHFQKEVSMNFILLDEKGCLKFKKNLKHTSGRASLQLQLPPLAIGVYNAWIQIEGRMFLRPIHIEKVQKMSLIQKIQQWLYICNTNQSFEKIESF